MHDNLPSGSISDTAYWVAYYRAVESERSDALFHDPYARQLVGKRDLPSKASSLVSGIIAQRTVVFDELIVRTVQREKIDLIVNLAAGLDTRPYRLALPSALRWVEVDLPDLIRHKEALLRQEKPICQREAIGLHLADPAARRDLLARIRGDAERMLVVSEGLLLYLTESHVTALSHDLYAQEHVAFWITDLMSPFALKAMMASERRRLEAVKAPLQFAPESGGDYFTSHGWHIVECRSALVEMRRLRRAPLAAALAFYAEKLVKRLVAREARALSGTVLLARHNAEAGLLRR